LLVPIKFLRKTALSTIQKGCGIKIAFEDVLWFEQGSYLRQRTAGNGIGERVQISEQEALTLINNSFGE
jgi:hypothetical protein